MRFMKITLSKRHRVISFLLSAIILFTSVDSTAYATESDQTHTVSVEIEANQFCDNLRDNTIVDDNNSEENGNYGVETSDMDDDKSEEPEEMALEDDIEEDVPENEASKSKESGNAESDVDDSTIDDIETDGIFSDELGILSAKNPELLGATNYHGTWGGLTWTLDSEGTLIISGEGEMDEYRGNNQGWRQYERSIKSVIINEGVTSIGSGAFSGCIFLSSVVLPESITYIDSAFYECARLKTAGPVGGDYNVKFAWKSEIPNGAFWFPDLSSVIIPETVTCMGESAFRTNGCLYTAGPIGGDYNIQFGWKTVIPDNAFSGCGDLVSVTIPEEITSLGDAAFSGCSSLTTLTIPESVTSIGDKAFRDCNNLTSVVIPEGVTSIGDYAFCGCSNLTSVVIPESVTSIGDYAFCRCSNLTTVVIPESVTSIGDYAFYGCSNLASVVIPESVTSIGCI